MELFTSPELWAALITLTAMEIVLGIDNIIFISILTNKLPLHQQSRVRTIGLLAALVMRIGLLFSLSWMMSLTTPLFTFLSHGFTGRDLILLGGGLFLIWKSSKELYEKVESKEHEMTVRNSVTVLGTIVQIMLIDIVFSLDSVITAIGMSNSLPVMVAAIVIAVGVMLFSASHISDFVNRHPSVKVLALSFLLLIGGVLSLESWGIHVAKPFVYFAMAFSFFVEMLNLRMRSNKKN